MRAQTPWLECSPDVYAHQAASDMTQCGRLSKQAPLLHPSPPCPRTELHPLHFPALALPLSQRSCSTSPVVSQRVAQWGTAAPSANGGVSAVRRFVAGATPPRVLTSNSSVAGATPPRVPTSNSNAAGATPPRVPAPNFSAAGLTPPRLPTYHLGPFAATPARACLTPPKVPWYNMGTAHRTPPQVSAYNSSATSPTPPHTLSYNASVSDGTPPQWPSPIASAVYSTPPQVPSCNTSASPGMTPSDAPSDILSASGGTSLSEVSSAASLMSLSGSSLLLPTLNPDTTIMCRWEVNADGRRNGACTMRMRDLPVNWNQNASCAAPTAEVMQASAVIDARSSLADVDCPHVPTKFSCSPQVPPVGLDARGHSCRFGANLGLSFQAARLWRDGIMVVRASLDRQLLTGNRDWQHFSASRHTPFVAPTWNRV
eukprot:GEMP01030044.1.p1 GENE.GEMP01030044.1~~GEMP01030044.1.p1  ORF type:complete len:428 (+),score=91.86 GEMP01030044.1:147-1430(+)